MNLRGHTISHQSRSEYNSQNRRGPTILHLSRTVYNGNEVGINKSSSPIEESPLMFILVHRVYYFKGWSFFPLSAVFDRVGYSFPWSQAK